mmetsp:Transcript_7362/g.19915  ORF Transcript_7362/g.19915 Transcript_7362/m.19915 type:complete len:200 (+) Transcript_7362:54-653(+)
MEALRAEHPVLHALHQPHPTVRRCDGAQAAPGDDRWRGGGGGLLFPRGRDRRHLHQVQREEGGVEEGAGSQRRRVPGHLPAQESHAKADGVRRVGGRDSVHRVHPQAGHQQGRVPAGARGMDPTGSVRDGPRRPSHHSAPPGVGTVHRGDVEHGDDQDVDKGPSRVLLQGQTTHRREGPFRRSVEQIRRATDIWGRREH